MTDGSAMLEELCELIDEQRAYQLTDQFGGPRLYAPKSIGEHHPITATIPRTLTRTQKPGHRKLCTS